MKLYLSIALLLFLTACSNSTKKQPLEPPIVNVIGEEIIYSQDNKEFKGYLTYDKESQEKRPGIVLIHHWKGLDKFTEDQADKFAKAGYIVFAMDMYGEDVKITTHEEAGKISGYYKNNRDVMRSRIEKSIEILKNNPYVSKDQLSVVGYCFGGDALIDYMLYKDDFIGGISFHGFYTSPLIGKELNGKLQIHHGMKDKASTMEELNKFINIHPNSETYIYDNVGHAYTDPGNINYSKEEAVISFERAKSFLKRNLEVKSKDEFLNYSVEIKASPQEVFSYINTPGKNELWIDGLYEEKSLYKEEGTYLNSRFIQKIKSFGMDMEFLGVITSYSEYDYIEMYYSDNRFILKLDYILEPTENGTMLTHKGYSVKSNGIINFFNKIILKKQIDSLKKVAEENSKK